MKFLQFTFLLALMAACSTTEIPEFPEPDFLDQLDFSPEETIYPPSDESARSGNCNAQKIIVKSVAWWTQVPGEGFVCGVPDSPPDLANCLNPYVYLGVDFRNMTSETYGGLQIRLLVVPKGTPECSNEGAKYIATSRISWDIPGRSDFTRHFGFRGSDLREAGLPIFDRGEDAYEFRFHIMPYHPHADSKTGYIRHSFGWPHPFAHQCGFEPSIKSFSECR